MTTRAVDALREIMLSDDDEDLPLRRRVEASEALLDYETTPEVSEECKEFLTQVAEDKDTPIDLRLSCLKLIRRVEARKVVPARVTVRDDYGRVEHRRLMETLYRRAALIRAGVWPFPKGWDSYLVGDDYVPLPDDNDEPPAEDLAAALRRARLRHLAKTNGRDN